jgi:hypothetical protein
VTYPTLVVATFQPRVTAGCGYGQDNRSAIFDAPHGRNLFVDIQVAFIGIIEGVNLFPRGWIGRPKEVSHIVLGRAESCPKSSAN